MRYPPRRLLRVALAAGLAALGLLAVASPAQATAEPIGDCTTTSGVILAVDFAHWGGPLIRACGSTPTTGLALLNEGGWSTTGDKHDGPGFICRIAYAGYDGGTAFPTPSQDACIVTPPATAYWSYWHADPGQNTWSYSHLGAGSYQPKPGSVDLWVFGSTDIGGTSGSGVPTFSPNNLRALNTKPVGVSTSAAGGGGNPATHGSAPSHAAATGEPAASSNPGSAAAASSNPPADGTTGSDEASQIPSILDVGPSPTATAAATARSSHGSAIPALVTLGVIVVLGGAGIAFALRRPRTHG